MKKLTDEQRAALSTIGRMGGRQTAKLGGHDHYVAIGRMGGRQTAKLGHDHYVAIGKKGGAKVRAAFAAARELDRDRKGGK